MSQQIDPRLHSTLPPSQHPHPSPGQHGSYNPATGPLPPPSNQSRQLPHLSNGTPPQQPYYHLPPQAPLQHQAPQYDPSRNPGIPQYAPPYNLEPPYDANAPPDVEYNLPEEQKRSRACEACRGLKVRCDRDENEPDRPCRRCAKARRACIITAPSRKRQKKTDSRVAELEKKIDALTADLRKHQSGTASATPESYNRDEGPISPPRSTTSGPTPGISTPGRNGAWKRDMEDRTTSQPGSVERELSNEGLKRRNLEAMPDIETSMMQRRGSADSSITSSSEASTDLPVDRIVDRDEADKIFYRFVAEMAHYLPAVMFEPTITADEIRTKRPVLFLAILDTASVGLVELETQYSLNEMLLSIFADRILRQGEKSLDLVQALMVSTIWYRPPRRYDQMNVYMLTHIAALMALDFGMGRKLNASRSMRVAANVGQSQAPKTFLRSDSVEARRTWLGCYFGCMNVSLSLRRPNFIRWNSYLEECIKVLESAPETLPSDKRLCIHVKLMHINEEVGIRFSMDDPSAQIAVSDPRVQFALSDYEKKLEEWAASVPKSQWDLSLEFSKHYSRLYMHEIALHNNHNIDDFRAPFTEESLKAPSIQAKSLSAYHQGLLGQCLSACHEMLRTFTEFDVLTLKALPIYYFVRVAYAVVVLIKLHYAVCDPNNDINIREDQLQVEYHLDHLLQSFHRIAAEDSFRPARMFLIIVTKLRDGFKRSKKNPSGVPSGAETQQLYSMEPTTKQRKKKKDRSQGTASSQSSTVSASNSRRASEQMQHTQSPPLSMQHQQQQQQQQQQQHPPPYMMQHQQGYDGGQTPLHFLSEVAATSGQNIANSLAYHRNGQMGGGPWHPMGYGPPPMMMARHTPDYSGDPAFEQAVDMALNIGEGDLSTLFMDDGGYGYAPQQPQPPESRMNADGINHYSGAGASGW